VVLASILVCGAPRARAGDLEEQSDGGGEDAAEHGPKLRARLAAGPAYAPDYDGSDEYVPVPFFEGWLYYGDFFAKAVGGQLRINVVPDASFHAGPVAAYRRGRDNVRDDQVDRLPSVDPGMEAGGFVEYEHHWAGNPIPSERLTLFVRHGVIGEGGTRVTLRAVVRRPLAPGLILAVAPGVTWTDAEIMRTDFGVSDAASARSGLPAFDPGAGFRSAGLGVALDQFLSRHWSVGLRGHYARLLGDAAASPVVDVAGSANQFFAAFVLGYLF
jgi:outer membrane scaffolding protein for murein synthesis (MipA/OmpV family)